MQPEGLVITDKEYRKLVQKNVRIGGALILKFVGDLALGQYAILSELLRFHQFSVDRVYIVVQVDIILHMAIG